MTRDETKQFMQTLTGLYPNFKYAGTPTIDCWQRALEHVTYEDADNALIRYARTEEKEFAPTVNRILTMCKAMEKSGGKCNRFVCRDEYGYFFREFDEYGDIVTRKCWRIGENEYIDAEKRIYADPASSSFDAEHKKKKDMSAPVRIKRGKIIDLRKKHKEEETDVKERDSNE